MSTMSTATKTNTKSRALHAADGHDLIRVHGARENNLKDLSVELRLVFTGVSGSGKSSLVFATIAAESQRLISASPMCRSCSACSIGSWKGAGR
jgi:putative ribosome biogenesis GTPase RsgA